MLHIGDVHWTTLVRMTDVVNDLLMVTFAVCQDNAFLIALIITMTLNLMDLWVLTMTSIMRVLEVEVFMRLLWTIYIDIDLMITMQG